MGAVPVLLLFCIALLANFVVLPCVLSMCFSVLLALPLPRFGKRELICVIFMPVCVWRLLVCVSFLVLFVSGIGCDLYFWHFLDFSVYLMAI